MFWRWHFLAAFIVIPFVLWQSTTGTAYLWSEWWMDLRYPELRFVPASEANIAPSVQLAAAIAAASSSADGTGSTATAEHAGHEGGADLHTDNQLPVQQIVLSDDLNRSTEVLLLGADGLPYPVFVNPHDGHVLGQLTSGQWIPGITRALHGGWPLGKPGNWLLELGNCWAIVMLITGLYLWWPRSRNIWRALWPRFRSGPRVLLRDAHAIVAVAFSAVLLFFLISALPWTSFWGGQVLSRVQSMLDQTSPAGFSIGGASAAQMMAVRTSIDAVVQSARQRDVKGTITVQMSPWQGAPLFVANRTSSLGDDRTLNAAPETGQISTDVRNADLPTIPRMVAVGIHVHQGDFGPINLWLNTSLAVALIWISVTGLISWWMRRPQGRIGIPPPRPEHWPVGLVGSLWVAGIVLPIFGLSLVTIAGVSSFRRLLYRPTTAN
nr:PepSY domain-containing protein [Bradyrhizobium sp. A19]